MPTSEKPLLKLHSAPAAGLSYAQFRKVVIPAFRPYQEAFGRIRSGQFTGAEARHISRIEDYRLELLGRKDPITFVDFGSSPAGSPTGKEDEIYGLASEQKVADLAMQGVPSMWGQLLLCLARDLQSVSILELGTGLGISTYFLLSALRITGRGRLLTMEGSASLASIARQELQRAGGGNLQIAVGRFHDNLEAALTKLAVVDFVFIDGHYRRDAIVEYYRTIRRHLTEDSTIVFNNMDEHEDVYDAWRSIGSEPEVNCTIDLGKFGICLYQHEGFDEKHHFDFRLWER